MNPKKWIVKNIFSKYRQLRYALIDNPAYLKRIREKYQFKEGVRDVFIIGVPNHCNLGDYAIGFAEERLLRKMYPDDKIYSINMTEFGQDIDGIRTYVRKDDIFILTGGGNLGNVYMDDENIRRCVIKMFPDNRIILFPQTMHFTNDEDGLKEKQLTKEIYNNHKHLTLTAREETSQHLMEELFERRVWLLPDVVMTLKNKSVETVRDGAYICIRNDKEGIVSEKDKMFIAEVLENRFSYVGSFDTVRNEIDTSKFKKCFSELISEFKSAEIVVTDRLHGMVLAAVTGTPCIVLGNYNHKVKGCYQWFKDLEYVQTIDDIREIEKIIDSIDLDREYSYDNTLFEEMFKSLLGDVING